MVRNMQKKDSERHQKQKEMHFQMMTQHWDDMIKKKQELVNIDRIFKSWA